ncbi:hypothetical protein LSH36_776g00043 [Paralvinella palmiformis]|uniref:Uncharacterized protein n=1 Tax=Paralvinella palmiformis TaxID=53620 RepID=A0AAD9J0B0_9ANNE|nr:hypothetical protein LSH36_776g00043 [Paralvinella palmiformis]
MEEYPETILTCMTQHHGFVANCLNSWMLLTSSIATSININWSSHSMSEALNIVIDNWSDDATV